jgi:hypothetical protein
VVFDDGVRCWLADGYHRFDAYCALKIEAIEAVVFSGSRRDALRYSLSANAKHGKRREDIDYDRAYRIAVQHELLDAYDIEAVCQLLQCSLRTAQRLTEPARRRRDAERDAAIAEGRAAGKSGREIARETGVPETTVRRSGAPSSPMAKTAQPSMTSVAAELTRIGSPENRAWHDLLGALRAINELPAPDAMLAYTGRRIDAAVREQLPHACDWLTSFQGEFDVRNAERDSR